MGGQHGLRNRDGGVVGFLAGEINPGGGVIPRAGDFDWCWDGSGGRGGGRGAVLRKDDDARFVRREIEIEFGAGGFRDLGVEGIPPGDVGSGRAEGGGGMDGGVGSVGEEVDVGEIELAVDEADFGGGGELSGGSHWWRESPRRVSISTKWPREPAPAKSERDNSTIWGVSGCSNRPGASDGVRRTATRIPPLRT